MAYSVNVILETFIVYYKFVYFFVYRDAMVVKILIKTFIWHSLKCTPNVTQFYMITIMQFFACCLINVSTSLSA